MRNLKAQSRISSYKGNYVIVKGRVIATDNSTYSIKVRVPSYHGIDDITGIPDSEIPWTQVCAPIIRNQGFMSSLFGNIFSELSGGNQDAKFPILPSKGDLVWVTFEGGDIRFPVYLGTLYTKKILNLETSSLYVSGGNLASLATDVIIDNLDPYDLVISDEEGTTIGKMRWNGNNARNILISMKSSNSENFLNTLKQYDCEDFLDDLRTSKNWNMNYRLGIYSPRGKAVKEILGKDYSRNVQRIEIQSQMVKNIEKARALGISDNAAAIYFADIYQENSQAASMVASSSDNIGNLNSIHEASLQNLVLGKNETRRNNTFSKISDLKNAGKLEPIVSSTGSDLTGDMFSYTPGMVMPVDLSPGGLAWPVPGYNNISSGYGPRSYTYKGKLIEEIHYGIDIPAPEGTNIIATGKGVVTGINNIHSSYGNHVVVTLENGIICISAHMVRLQASRGQAVVAGTIIGNVGSTGASTGNHCHYEMRNPPGSNQSNYAFDPTPYIR